MHPDDSRLEAISRHAFDDESAAVRALLSAVAHLAPLELGIQARARAWTQAIREQGPGHGMEAFLQTYGFDTREGAALMCLAEALLRIPDTRTANRLIEDTFAGKDWHAAGNPEADWQVTASRWGLLLGGKLLDVEPQGRGLSGRLRQSIARVGEPVVREALKAGMRVIGGQFVLGETIEEGLRNSAAGTREGYRFSYDILGEGARSDAQAQAYVAAYRHAIVEIGSQARGLPLAAAPSISVKLSALHPRYTLNQRARVIAELLPRVKEILLLAQQQGISVSLDAEEANRLDLSLQLWASLMADPDLRGFNGIGFVLQAYQKRAIHVVGFLADLARAHGRQIPLRLVKGAYWDSEIKHAQIHGLPDYPVFTRKEHTDLSYLACADAILQQGEVFYPQFATHNARTIASIEALAAHYAIAPQRYEFQRLHGMGESLHRQILPTFASRIYAPIGAHKDLLAYLIRRLLENGANSSFVRLLTDDAVTIDELLADPVMRSAQGLQREEALPRPHALYPDRQNSPGVDAGYLHMRQQLEAIVAHAGALTPAMPDHTPYQVAPMAQAASAQVPAWEAIGVEARAQILEAIAQQYLVARDDLLRLLVREGGKTLTDAWAEWREAIDFCRYYAASARALLSPQTLLGPTGESNVLSLHPRGVFACISPWNFPLAIFTGQIVAALVTGNAVIAKPAEQTPRIAVLATRLMHAAGVPADVLQLACGAGETVGAALCAEERIGGIAFTGSMPVARQIAQTLAARPGPIGTLIAETGGLNCCVIDSSALLEAALDDVLHSAFGSAGQRCSALRVLYVQEEIAEAFTTLLRGAMQELSLGDPASLASDIGPVIDAQAQEMLQAHIARMREQATLLAVAPAAADRGNFVAPHAFEIPSIDWLTQEIFGPVLHVIRFRGDALQAVADAINGTGYGLTFGIHSRVEQTIQFFLTRIRAGNCYVNRGMTGAVVGVQPFGGEGLSGTGPKAGGPHTLLRFMTERAVTINTAAIGGNLSLLSGQKAAAPAA